MRAIVGVVGGTTTFRGRGPLFYLLLGSSSGETLGSYAVTVSIYLPRLPFNYEILGPKYYNLNGIYLKPEH